MWEDQKNRRGGRWVINLEKKKRNTELDMFWLETVRKYFSWLNDSQLHYNIKGLLVLSMIVKSEGFTL